MPWKRPRPNVGADDGETRSWHDRAEEKRQSITVGERQGAKRLRKAFASELKAKPMPISLDLQLAFGRPNAYPEQRVKVSGFKPEIDAVPWLITEVSHRLDSNGGFTTDLRMETAEPFD